MKKGKFKTAKIMKCEDMQELFLEFGARELGGARSDMVRDHLEKCETCQEAYKEVQETLAFLRKTSIPDQELPNKLSTDHQARLSRALMHPVREWIFTHHTLVSIIITIVAVVLTAVYVRKFKPSSRLKITDPGIKILIQPMPRYDTNSAPEQVSEEE
jgi:predicted anti-sigma-YlaC factor YlaD